VPRIDDPLASEDSHLYRDEAIAQTYIQDRTTEHEEHEEPVEHLMASKSMMLETPELMDEVRSKILG
jgi:hypothetical protein